MSNKINIDEVTTIGSVAGSPDSPNYGFFIGPLGSVPSSVLNKRLLWKTKGVKNSTGATGKIVTPPQGFVSEYLYEGEGELVTESKLIEWFGNDMKKKPSWNGGKLVAIALLLFAFSTAITWCYYGDRSTAYIFGERGVFWYRNFYVLCFILAAVIDTTIVWNIAYVVVALVTIPNLIALFVLRKEMKEQVDTYVMEK